MSFFKRLWGYIKALFRSKAEGMMDPEIEIKQAIDEARKRDQDLRNQAAKVVAHRTQLESKIERAADDVVRAVPAQVQVAVVEVPDLPRLVVDDRGEGVAGEARHDQARADGVNR